LNTIAASLNREAELSQALEVALKHVAELLHLHTGWIFLLDEETHELYLAASLNLPPALTKSPRRMQGTCYCLDTYLAGDMDGAANVNVITCTRLKDLVDGTDGLRYHASIPLYARDKKLGVLNVASPDWRGLSQDDLRLLYTVGDLLSMAVERSRLYSKSTELGIVEERNRLAREIHDTVAQGLAAISLRLETAEALLETDAEAEKVQRTIHQALELTRANLDEVRRSVLDLRAAPLEGRTLVEALQKLAETHRQQWGLDIEFESTGNHPLSVRLEIGLYRVAQEALTNVGRHAAATTVCFKLATTPQKAQLIVEDDGCGFDSNATNTEGHYGLVGINERVKLMGGKLQINSSLGDGTRLEVIIPMEANK
jgi:two-component system NarL family sensor kinase